MSRHRKILIVVVVALGATILIPIIHHYQLRAAVNAYIAELKAKGEPMELSQVIPPPLPPEQNSADTFRKAATLFDADQSLFQTNSYSAMRMVAPGKAMVCSQQPDARGYNATSSWEEVTAAVAQNEKSFGLLQQIIDKPSFDFQIKYGQGIANLDFTNLNLAPLKIAAMRLSTAALCNLHRSDTASAVRNLRAMLVLIKAAREERFVISELVRIAIVQIALTVNWEILQSPNLTDEQLVALQRDWTSLEFIQAGESALAMERVTGEITLAQWRSSNSELERYFDLGRRGGLALDFPEEKTSIWNRAKMTAKIFMWRYWWSYPDELRCLRGYQTLMESMKSAGTNGLFHTALQDQELRLHALGIDKLGSGFDSMFSPEKTDFHSLLSQSIVDLGPVVSKVMRTETAKQMVIAAIALKRYQLKHGNYPADLNSLAPEFVQAVPLDPVDGQPLRYRLNPDGTFLLYSVGENGKDDGGDPSLKKGVQSSSFYWENPKALDWVWPQPATAEEVQFFYDHPPK